MISLSFSPFNMSVNLFLLITNRVDAFFFLKCSSGYPMRLFLSGVNLCLFSPFPISIFIIKFLHEFENFGEHVYFILSEKASGFSLLFLSLLLLPPLPVIPWFPWLILTHSDLQPLHFKHTYLYLTYIFHQHLGLLKIYTLLPNKARSLASFQFISAFYL